MATHDDEHENPPQKDEQPKLDLDQVEVREIDQRETPRVRTGLRGGWSRAIGRTP